MALTTVTGSMITPSTTLSGDVTVTGTMVMGSSFMRNRIINGDMRIDQRNAGASVTPAPGDYTLDRWQFELAQTSKLTCQRNAGSVTPPAGFTNYLGITSSSAYTPLTNDYFWVRQVIEGFNIADFNYGTASAVTTTLSFWARSSLTGTFSGSLCNSSNNRVYPFIYTISAANTWEQKTITVAGDTSGTWLTDNSAGLKLQINLGTGSGRQSPAGSYGAWVTPTNANADYRGGVAGTVSLIGTNGATFYITGVQLEVGTSATPFERRLYNQELAACQRYLPVIQNNTGERLVGPALTSTRANITITYQVTPRVPPTGITATTASNFGTYVAATAGQPTPTSIAFSTSGLITASINVDVSSGFTAGQYIQFFPNNSSAQILFTGCEL